VNKIGYISEYESGKIEINKEIFAYSILRSQKRKRSIAFRISAEKKIEVIAPQRTSLAKIEDILKKRSAWLVRELSKMAQTRSDVDFSDGSVFPYMGHDCTIKATQQPDSSCCQLKKRAWIVNIRDCNLSSEALRQEIRLELILWLKKRARKVFQKRVSLWAKRLNVNHGKIIVSDTSSRWGSCSADNIIRLNWRLMLIPMSLIDYVVAHELCHVVHKNHSSKFWAFLAKAMPDHKSRRSALRYREKWVLAI